MGLTEAYRKGNNGRPGWAIRFTFDADQIEALKRAVPYQDRSYRESDHEWWIAAEHEATLLRLWPAFEAHLRQQAMF